MDGSSQNQQLASYSCTTFPQWCQAIKRMPYSAKDRLWVRERDNGSDSMLFLGRGTLTSLLGKVHTNMELPQATKGLRIGGPISEK